MSFLSDIRKRLYQLPGIRSVSIKEESKEEFLRLLREFTVFSHIMWLMSIIIVFSITFNTLTINTMERRYGHATLMALGVNPKRLSRILLFETLIMTIPALIIGIILGYITADLLIKIFAMTVTEQMMHLQLYISLSSYLETISALFIPVLLAHLISSRQIKKYRYSGYNSIRELIINAKRL